MKTNKNKRYLENSLIVLVLIFFTIVACKEISGKQDRHVDEYLSYMLANDTGSGLTLNVKNTNAKQEMDSYLTVNENNPPFNYKNVWKNQSADTHPPLYYAVLHTVCSFFPNVFSTWFAVGINIFFMCMSIIVIYRLIKALTQNIGISLAITFAFALNPSIIEIVTFGRMYTMVMFWCVLMTYISFKYIGNLNRRAYFFLGFVIMAGTLTHYYFIFFATFIIGIILLNELINRRLKNIFKLGIVLLVTVTTTVVIFRPIIKHLLLGNRGKENLSNLLNFSDYFRKLKGYINILNEDVFYNVIVVLLLAGILGFIYLNYEKKEYIWKSLILTIPSLMYFLLISKVSSYTTDRYMSMIYPIIIMSVYVGIYYCINFLLKLPIAKSVRCYSAYSSIVILTLVVCLLTLKGYKNYSWDYSSKDYADTIAPLTENLSDNDVYILKK